MNPRILSTASGHDVLLLDHIYAVSLIMPGRHQPLRPKRPCNRHPLPWGHDASVKDNIFLDAFVEIITEEDIEPSARPEVKNVLIYRDRGDLNRGDEAKLREMEIYSYNKQTSVTKCC